MAAFSIAAPATVIRSIHSKIASKRGSRGRSSPILCGSRARTSPILCDFSNTRQEGSLLGVDSRRQTLLKILFSGISFPAIASSSLAEEDLVNFQTYEDEANKFRISFPQEWLAGTGDSNTIKSVTAFFPEAASETNVSVVITGIGPDFTRLESFGKVDEFAETLVTGMDRSWKSPPGLAAKLINSKARNGFYYIEYTLQNPGERQRHILSAIGMANNGWYNRLYTVTGQFFEDESDKFRSQIEKCVSSFRFT